MQTTARNEVSVSGIGSGGSYAIDSIVTRVFTVMHREGG